MKRKYLDLYLGVFVFAGLIAAAYMILRFGGMSTEERYQVIVLFDRVEALIREAPVYHAGVECGIVTKIVPIGGLVDGKPNIPMDKVKVVLSVNQDTTIRKEDVISVETVSLLGEKAVEIVPGRFGAEPLPKDGSAVVVGKNPEGLFAPLRDLLGPLADRETQEYIANILRSFSDSIPPLMANLTQLTGEELQLPLKDALDNLSRAANEFPKVLDNFGEGVRTFTRAGEEVEKLIIENREQIGGLIATADQSLKSFNRVVDGLYPVVEDLKAGRGGLGKLVRDSGWYTNFNKILIALREYGPVRMDEAFKKEQEEARRRPAEPPVRVW